ncbi:TfoX/Sxy family protein [Leptospira kirschneri]|uniref:TfoX N-terminal domain protein n=1 Tax=Leptospira kirschneri str. H1 TaxID=1049966 RepID=A0A0E2B5Q8_9LEPT|nr:TfoX/Sxy family protein [Leptospira kirschneri]EKO16185.1 TfoX N-terminal domain protein [Leptospira kirschneri str. H1]EKO60357.1 TfoX N-terminal domain protein [Leptospira kirschneri str. H2]UML80279.1 TfoX/Sxy family protein [Leptospira kirschneri]
MASDLSFVDFIVDQVKDAGQIVSKKMFGEYAIYCNGKIVALVCDNHLFVKPTEGGRKWIGNVQEAPAYPGAKPSFLILDRLKDKKWMSHLVKITAQELPEPKMKPKKKKRIVAKKVKINKK